MRSERIGSWDNQEETGHTSPVRLTIDENGISLLEVTGQTPEQALCTALHLVADAHSRTGRADAIARAVTEAAEALDDGLVLQAHLEDQA